MSSVAQAKAAIYSRLANAPTFHPSNADLFADWTLQGGDIVSVQSGSETYSLPIYSLNIKWNGVPKVSVANSGNEYRGSLEKMAQKEYGRRGGGYRGGLRDAEGNLYWASEIYSEDGTLHSLIYQTSSVIMTAVENVSSDLHSFILQTPEMIHAEVGSAVSGFAQSVIEQTATYIRTEVSNAASAISQTVIEQTTEYIVTEVSSVASGIAWSVVMQTMTGIIQEVHRKSKIYVQWTDPNDGVNVLYEGDLWYKRQTNRTWGEANAAGEKWSQSGVPWKSKYGDIYYVWKNGQWNLVKDYAVDVENEVRIEHSETEYAVLAKAVTDQGNEFNSKLAVTAREIRTDVSTSKSQIYSTISQTATNITAHVANEVEGLQSQIEQTASQITTSVSAAKSALYSTIMQTATNIRSTVNNQIADVQSSIEQTASSITTQVSAAKSAMYSVIQQTATSIRAEVASSVSSLQSSIEQTASSITTSVSAAKSSMYTVIQQTASGINQTVATKVGKTEVISSINQTAESVTISASKINLSGVVWADYITSNYIEGVIGGITSLGVKSLAASGTISIKDGNVYYTIERSINDINISRSGNTYTLQYKKWGDSSWTNVSQTFSRAVDSMSWGWSNGTITVTPSPQEQNFNLGDLVLATSLGSWDGNTYTAPIHFNYGGSRQYYEATGKNISVDATTRYNAGFDANHSLFIGDTNYTAKPGNIDVSVGSPQEVWAYFKKSDNSTYQWSNKYTITAINPYPSSITVIRVDADYDTSSYAGMLYKKVNGQYQPCVSSGSYYWYYSSTNLGVNTKELHY